MSLKLYFHPLASFCHKALIALYEAAYPLSRSLSIWLMTSSSAAFKAVWPLAKIPVLRDEARDRTVAEATIIIEYLDAYYPGPTQFLPTDADRAWQTRCVGSLPILRRTWQGQRPELRLWKCKQTIGASSSTD